MFLLRRAIIGIVTMVMYGGTIYTLFFLHDFLSSFPFLLLLFCLLHFLVIETKQYTSIKSYLLLFGGGAGIISILAGTFSLFPILSISLFHLGLFLLVFSIHDEISNRKNISLRSVVHSGAYVFTASMTLAYSTLGIGVFKEFTLTCDQMYGYVDRITGRFTGPFHGTSSVERWGSMPVPEVLGLTQQIVISENTALFQTTGTIVSPKEIKGDISAISKVESLGNTTISGFIGLLGWIDIYKQRFINQVMQDSTLVNKGVCDYLIIEIAQRFNKPVFQFSVVLLLFILVSPLVRIVVFIFEIIMFILLQFFFLIRLYHFVPIKQIGEDIE